MSITDNSIFWALAQLLIIYKMNVVMRCPKLPVPTHKAGLNYEIKKYNQSYIDIRKRIRSSIVNRLVLFTLFCQLSNEHLWGIHNKRGRSEKNCWQLTDLWQIGYCVVVFRERHPSFYLLCRLYPALCPSKSSSLAPWKQMLDVTERPPYAKWQCLIV